MSKRNIAWASVRTRRSVWLLRAGPLAASATNTATAAISTSVSRLLGGGAPSPSSLRPRVARTAATAPAASGTLPALALGACGIACRRRLLHRGVDRDRDTERALEVLLRELVLGVEPNCVL